MLVDVGVGRKGLGVPSGLRRRGERKGFLREAVDASRRLRFVAGVWGGIVGGGGGGGGIVGAGGGLWVEDGGMGRREAARVDVALQGWSGRCFVRLRLFVLEETKTASITTPPRNFHIAEILLIAHAAHERGVRRSPPSEF